MIFAFGSAKSGPVTTSVLALAATWPDGQPPVVLELDPAGGDLAVWFGLRCEPGLVTLAAAARRGVGAALRDHTQTLPGGIPVVVAPPSAEQAGAALRALGDRLHQLLLAEPAGVLVDCGRLSPSPIVDALLGQAASPTLVARPGAQEVAHLGSRVAALRESGVGARLLLVGSRPYGAEEVATVLDTSVLGVLADDAEGARGLAGHPVGARALQRSALLASARPIAALLATQCGPLQRPGSGPASSKRGSQAAGGDSPVAAGGHRPTASGPKVRV